MPPKLPLEGIRIVDICVIWAGPYGAWLLGSLGAEVIHIDNPFHFPDNARSWNAWTEPKQVFNPAGGGPIKIPGQRQWNESLYSQLIWNRKSCSINLNSPEGKEVFKRLIATADIFMENNGADAMEHLGLGHETLMEINERLICLNMPAWGSSGPYRNYLGIGAIHQSIAGEDWIRGYNDADHPSHNNWRYPMDTVGGIQAAAAAIMGLVYRHRTGKGLWVDYAQAQNIPNQLAEIYMDAAWNDRCQRTLGNRHPTAVQGCYLCRGPKPTLETAAQGGERWINITLNNDEEWEGLCRAMNDPEWTKDPQFATHESRYANHDEFDKYLSSWTKTHDNVEIFYMLQEQGVPAGPVLDARETFNDPQLNSRNFFVTTGNKDAGYYRFPGYPWKFSETKLRKTHDVFLFGEDTEYVCKEVIGMSEEEFEDLKAKEVVAKESYAWALPRPDYEGWAKEHGIEI